MKNLILPILLMLFVFTGCKKTTTSQYSNVTQVSSAPIPVPAAASGLLYANNYITYYTNQPGHVDTLYQRNEQAYFFANGQQVKAGMVTMNTDTLQIDSSAALFYTGAYQSNTGPINLVTWAVRGNAGSGIPAFTNTDNSPYATLNGPVQLPDSINANTGLSVNYTISGNYNVIYYTLSGVSSGSSVTTAVIYTGGSATNVTFSADQVAQIATNGALFISIILVKITPYTIGAQTYYLVNSNNYDFNTNIR